MAAISASDIIKAAMKELGVLGVGQSVNAEMEDDAFNALNRMLELWSTKALLSPYDVEEAETLTATQAEYTVGSGGDFDTNRPLEIKKDAFIRDSGGTDYPVQVLTLDVYRDKSQKTTAGRPDFLALQPEFPLAIIYLYPTPDSSTDELHYRARTLLDSFAELATSNNYPPAYEDAIILNLAIRIAPANRKRARPELLMLAADALKAIRNQNSEPVQPVKLEVAAMFGRRSIGNIEEGPFR